MSDKLADARAEIASRLRTAREAAGLSQGQVARMLGVHRPTISEIEAGRRRVSAEELSQLAKIYDVNPGWLTEGTTSESEGDKRLRLAARQLSKLKDQDLDRLMTVIRMLKRRGGA